MPVVSTLVRTAAVIATVAVLAGACSDAGSTPTSTTGPPAIPIAGAIAATVEAAIIDFGDPSNPSAVILAPLIEGTVLPLEVQAEVISLTAPTATVQFIDDPLLALVDDGAAVIDTSLLLLLTVLETDTTTAVIGGEHWRSATDVEAFKSIVAADGDRWVADLSSGTS
jgi:hypothetical protein